MGERTKKKKKEVAIDCMAKTKTSKSEKYDSKVGSKYHHNHNKATLNSLTKLLTAYLAYFLPFYTKLQPSLCLLLSSFFHRGSSNITHNRVM